MIFISQRNFIEGNGVEAFFYEPYKGLVQSPSDFVLGIGKGI